MADLQIDPVPAASGDEAPHRPSSRRAPSTSVAERRSGMRPWSTQGRPSLAPASDRGPAGRAAEALRAQQVVLAAVRAMAASEEPQEVTDALLMAVRRLGGRTIEDDPGDGSAIPVDLTRGAAPALFAAPDPDRIGSPHHLCAHLPALVEDARTALARLDRHARLADDAEHDALTGLLNRRAYDRLRGRLGPGDELVLLDLDDFKTVNDVHGHVAGDQVLRIFGSVLREQMRVDEHAVRLGGDEFLVVLRDADGVAEEPFLQRLRVAWRGRRPLPVTFSYGAAEIVTGIDDALEAADRSLYAYKRRRASSSTEPARR